MKFLSITSSNKSHGWRHLHRARINTMKKKGFINVSADHFNTVTGVFFSLAFIKWFQGVRNHFALLPYNVYVLRFPYSLSKFVLFSTDLGEMYMLLEHQAPIEEYADWLSAMIQQCVVKVTLCLCGFFSEVNEHQIRNSIQLTIKIIIRFGNRFYRSNGF